MRKTYKVLSVVLAFLMVFSIMPITSTAKTTISGMCGDNVTWDMNLSTGTLTFSGSGKMYQKYGNDVDIPWEDYWRYIKTVVIEEDIEFIDVWLFNFSCSNKFVVDSDNQYYSSDEYGALFNKDKTILFQHSCANTGNSYTIPDTVTTICKESFAGCITLESIVFSNSVKTIGDYAFYGCNSIADIKIPDSVETIGNSAFSACSSLEKVTLGAGVQTIDSGAFAHCENLESIIIGNNVTKIGEGMLYQTQYANNLDNWESGLYVGDCLIDLNADYYSRQVEGKSIKLKEGTRLIADRALDLYDNEPITIPDSVEIISRSAFAYATISIEVDDNNQYFSSDENGVLFNKDKTKLVRYPKGNTRTSYIIPDSVTTIGENAFYDCDNLENITIPNSVEVIDKNAFFNCDNITDITIPNSVTTIGESAFEYCENLGNITLGNSVTTIGECAFMNCRKLENIDFPNSLTTIKENAFDGCTTLENIEFPNSLTTIGDFAFYGCDSIADIKIPDSVINIGVAAFALCSSLTGITVETNNQCFFNDETGVLFNKDKTKLVLYPMGIASTDYVVPDSVKAIDEYAFVGCENLKSITLPDRLISIGDFAFAGCNGFTEVVIPDSATEMGIHVYRDCINLKSVKIGKGITSIPRWSFYGCTSLKNVAIGENVTMLESGAFRECISLEDITLPDSVTTIGYGTFWSTGLKNITFGKGLRRIGSWAFCGCENLASITIPGNVREIGSCAFRDCRNLESVKIEKGTVTIGGYAFGDCIKLKDVKMPDSIWLICGTSFGYCEKLSDVYYSGTEERWSETIIEEDNQCLLNARFHFNYCEHQDSDGNGYCDDCEELLDPTVECECNCHKSGISKFFFNFILFFQRLFGANKECACGGAHY